MILSGVKDALGSAIEGQHQTLVSRAKGGLGLGLHSTDVSFAIVIGVPLFTELLQCIKQVSILPFGGNWVKPVL